MNLKTVLSAFSKVSTTTEIVFTGIVVTYNEARYLRACLNSLAFCEQLLVIDLGSTDNSLEIAKQCDADIIFHDWVPIVEIIRKEAIAYARNDWTIFLDPDEIFPIQAVPTIVSMIRDDPALGEINAPWQFYFKGKPLYCTIWGLEKYKGIVHHKDRNRFVSDVHSGTKLLNGYNSAMLARRPEYFLRHYWADSYAQLLRKHWRYSKNEGVVKYRSGQRFSWFRSSGHAAAALKTNLIAYEGFRGGIHGILLSLLYSFYVAMSQLALRRYQNQVRHELPLCISPSGSFPTEDANSQQFL